MSAFVSAAECSRPNEQIAIATPAMFNRLSRSSRKYTATPVVNSRLPAAAMGKATYPGSDSSARSMQYVCTRLVVPSATPAPASRAVSLRRRTARTKRDAAPDTPNVSRTNASRSSDWQRCLNISCESREHPPIRKNTPSHRYAFGGGFVPSKRIARRPMSSNEPHASTIPAACSRPGRSCQNRMPPRTGTRTEIRDTTAVFVAPFQLEVMIRTKKPAK